MARPRKETAPATLPALNDAAVADATAAADQQAARLAEIDTTYGDGLPYSRDRMITEIRVHLQRSAIDMLEAGKKLILIKEREPHGGFLEAIEHVGIAPRVAQRLMLAAVKFVGPNTKALSHLGITKMIELTSLDEQELGELAEGGTVLGMHLDDIERMSTRELQKALRDARADGEAKDQIIRGKDEKINELDRNAALQAKFADWSKEVRTWRQLIDTVSTDMERPLHKARAIMRDLLKLDVTVYEGQGDATLGPIVEWYFAALAVVRVRLDEVFFEALGEIGGYLTNPAVAPSRWEMPEELHQHIRDCIARERDAIRSLRPDSDE